MCGSKITPTLARPGNGLRQKTISRYFPLRLSWKGRGASDWWMTYSPAFVRHREITWEKEKEKRKAV
jgi:hypothetical protein